MKIKCVIVDDEPLARNVIQDYMDSYQDFEVVSQFSNAIDTQRYLIANDVDILFLDINMPKMTGVEMLKTVDNPPLVVFTTAYPEFAVEAFELEVFDYLLKPISFARFSKTILKLKVELSKAPHEKNEQIWMSLKEGKRLYKVYMQDIYLIQAYGDYVRVYTTEKIYITKTKFQEFIKDLPLPFLQVHRSYAVNSSMVNYIEGNHAMVEGEKVPISNSFRQELMDKMKS